MTPLNLNIFPSTLFPLGELSRRSAEQFGEAIAFRRWVDGGWRALSYQDLNRMASAIARWLLDAGLRKGERVGVLGDNSPEWSAAYLAAHTAGGVVVPIDVTLTPAGVKHILLDSEVQFLFASRKSLSDLLNAGLPDGLKGLINLSAKPLEGTILLESIIADGNISAAAFPSGGLDELACILYTSGTTGHSKGVMLSHRNLISNAAGASTLIPLGPGDTFLSVLPVHHSLEGTAGFLLPLLTGCSITYARSMKSSDLIGDIKQTGVTVIVGVPLLFEKMMAGIIKGVKKKGLMARVLFDALMNLTKTGESVGLAIGGKLFSGLRKKAGLGTIRYFFSGGGPLNPEVGMFFNRMGIKLLQGYGLTETSPITHLNPPHRIKFETVGKTLPEVECRLRDVSETGIGEVEIKGSNVFMGYYKNAEATAAVMTADGWLKTGDLGIIDNDGYLLLKGRKKNLIVTGGGKNVYPEEIEYYLNQQRFIADSLVLGVTRESGYGEEVGALIYADPEQLDQLREERGGVEISPEELKGIIQSAVEVVSQELADYKRIRKFKIMTDDFEKTSSRKIKRYLYSAEMLKE